ncbi:MAG: HEPN domain-containing protein [Armatimonadota bacterium]
MPPEQIEPGSAAELTSYAVHMRYPSTAEEATEGDYKQAIKIAKAVLRWAEQIIK